MGESGLKYVKKLVFSSFQGSKRVASSLQKLHFFFKVSLPQRLFEEEAVINRVLQFLKSKRDKI